MIKDKHANSKLGRKIKWEKKQIDEIKRLYNEEKFLYRDIAEKYDVSLSTIHNIVKDKKIYCDKDRYYQKLEDEAVEFLINLIPYFNLGIQGGKKIPQSYEDLKKFDFVKYVKKFDIKLSRVQNRYINFEDFVNDNKIYWYGTVLPAFPVD